MKSGDDHILSNEFIRIKINSDGRITSILDKSLDRELILADHTAGFVIFEDRPLNWSAWDVDYYHLQMKSPIDASSVRIVEDGPLKAMVLATYHFGDSEIKVRPSTRFSGFGLTFCVGVHLVRCLLVDPFGW